LDSWFGIPHHLSCHLIRFLFMNIARLTYREFHLNRQCTRTTRASAAAGAAGFSLNETLVN
jgi:hypothetical protein